MADKLKKLIFVAKKLKKYRYYVTTKEIADRR